MRGRKLKVRAVVVRRQQTRPARGRGRVCMRQEHVRAPVLTLALALTLTQALALTLALVLALTQASALRLALSPRLQDQQQYCSQFH